jgi:hypothetical protein
VTKIVTLNNKSCYFRKSRYVDSVVTRFLPIGQCSGFARQPRKKPDFWHSESQCRANASEAVHNHLKRLELLNFEMRQSYSSDISREAFEQIRPVLESVRKRTKPRTVDLYEVFCADIAWVTFSHLKIQ